MKSNLPAGWSIVKIGDILSFSGGGTPSKHVPKFWNGDISWASVKDVKGKYLTKTQDTITKAGLDASATQLAEPGSVLMVTRMAPGRPIITQVQTAINQDLKIVRPKLPIPSLFIYYAFLNYERKFLEIAGGTTVQGIRVEDIKELEIPFPPLAEQHRIVAQLEAIMQKLDASQERLEKLPVLLKKFRQAVLAAAVSGKLTEAWRAEQPIGETAEELLNRIRAERRTQWEVKQVTKMKGKQLALDDIWKQKHQETTEPDTSKLTELPDGWAWANLAQVCELISGQHIMNEDYNSHHNGVSYLTGPADFGTLYPVISKWTTLPKVLATKGDVLITVKGSGVGKVNMLNIEEAAISRQLMSIRSEVVSSEYLYHFLKTCYSRIQQLSTGTAIPGVGREDILTLILPIPPVAEQQEIVRQVNHYFALADQLEARFEQAAAMIEQLPQALLAKAFSGQLVPQDPNDEPSSALLERLQTSASIPAKGQRGRKPKSVAPTPLFN